MQALLTVIVTWLSVTFGLPEIHEPPQVEFVSEQRMAEVRYERLGADWPHKKHPSKEEEPVKARIGHGVHAIYDDRSRTIYLAEGWTGTTPAEVSVLVHEMVHHLQNLGGLTYDCAGAREKPAYQAQARWLELFGQSLPGAFQLDPMTILVRTNCMR